MNESTFFIHSHPPPPNNVAYHFIAVYLFGNIEKGGKEDGYIPQGERGEFTTRENTMVSNFNVSTTFVLDCTYTGESHTA